MTTTRTKIPRKKEEDFLYLKLVKDIKHGILTGTHPPGTQLPSYNELAKSYGIHRLTVRHALRLLKEEGLVYTIPAKGVYVAAPGSIPPRDPFAKNDANWSIGIVNDIVEPWLFGYFHFEILERMRNLLQRDLHSLQILPTSRQNRLEKWIAAIKHFDLTGLVLLGPLQPSIIREISRLKPVIHLDPQGPSDCTTVNIDNERGGAIAARHLLELGHTDIAIITSVDQQCSDQRLAGFRRAVEESGVPGVKIRTFAGNFSSVSGSAAAQQILAARELPTAVFCLNDEMALGALQTFTAASIFVPRDLSLIGFDDITVSKVVTPPLTTIRVSTADLAHTTVHAMERKLSGLQTNELAHTVVPTLVVRGSTAPPRA